jgi:hypothetical protein
MLSYRTLARWLSLLGVFAGVAHLLVPDHLLAAADWGYDRLLAVEFSPRSDATRRVRLIGLLMIVAGALGRRATRRDDRARSCQAKREE